MVLDQYFDETPDGLAVLQRWPTLDSDYLHVPDSSFARQVRRRPIVTIMRFGDYDHDGRPTEFLVHTSGYGSDMLVGISTGKPVLHAFGTALHPDSVLFLGRNEWAELLYSRDGHVTTLHLSCGDHGSEEEDDIELRTASDGIHATEYVYECGPTSRGKLTSKREF